MNHFSPKLLDQALRLTAERLVEFEMLTHLGFSHVASQL